MLIVLGNKLWLTDLQSLRKARNIRFSPFWLKIKIPDSMAGGEGVEARLHWHIIDNVQRRIGYAEVLLRLHASMYLT